MGTIVDVGPMVGTDKTVLQAGRAWIDGESAADGVLGATS